MKPARPGERQAVAVEVQPGNLKVQHAGKDIAVQPVRVRQGAGVDLLQALAKFCKLCTPGNVMLLPGCGKEVVETMVTA